MTERPPILHLAGKQLPCCGAWFLMDCDGRYRCPCGKNHEALGMGIVRRMNDEPEIDTTGDHPVLIDDY